MEMRMKALGAMAASGQLGARTAEAAREYEAVPAGVPTCLKVVTDLYRDLADPASGEVSSLVDRLLQVIVMVYREAKKADPEVAKAIANALIMDYPGAPGSCLFPKWDTLSKAAIAFDATKMTTAVEAWQQCKTIVEAANEFMSGLLGYLLAGWRCAQGKPVNPNLFKQAYGNKVNELAGLTGGDNGPFYLFLRLAQVPLRNAIAHGDAWVNSDENKIMYANAGVDYEMPLEEFGAYTLAGSWLGRAYLGAIATIVVLEDGNPYQALQLPHHLVKLFHHKPEALAST